MKKDKMINKLQGCILEELNELAKLGNCKEHLDEYDVLFSTYKYLRDYDKNNAILNRYLSKYKDLERE